MQSHAWLATIGWGLFIPCGIVMARSFKESDPAWFTAIDPMWFHVHRALMVRHGGIFIMQPYILHLRNPTAVPLLLWIRPCSRWALCLAPSRSVWDSSWWAELGPPAITVSDSSFRQIRAICENVPLLKKNVAL